MTRIDGCPRIIRLSETGSTNKDAMRLALTGEPLPLWVSADRQTGGKGRQGRSWSSLSGNLHASLAFPSCADPRTAAQIALVAGVAFHEAVSATSGLAHPDLRLKWPNDLLINSSKIGGILVESTFDARATQLGLITVIGFGLNVVDAPELDRPVSSLLRHGAEVDREILLMALADSCKTWLDKWDDGQGFHLIRDGWLACAGAIGESISVNTGHGQVRGSYQGLSSTGGLLLKTEGGLEAFNFGDVALGA